MSSGKLSYKRKRRRTEEASVEQKAAAPVEEAPKKSRIPWIEGIEELMKVRPRQRSPVALLINVLVQAFTLAQMLIEAGLKEQDLPSVEVIDEDGTLRLSQVTPKVWQSLETLVGNEKFAPKDENKEVALTPPDSFLEYHDHSVILYLNRPHPPKDVAFAYPEGIPQPVRIHRVYKKDKSRANCVKLIFKTLDERSIILGKGKIKLWGRKFSVAPMNKKRKRGRKTPAGRKKSRQGSNE